MVIWCTGIAAIPSPSESRRSAVSLQRVPPTSRGFYPMRLPPRSASLALALRTALLRAAHLTAASLAAQAAPKK